MNNYCTLFDSYYLVRGLTLYSSLVKTGESFTLFIYCFDEKTFDLLKKMNLPHTRLISLSQFESPELLEVKKTRTRGEYCWTCTSQVIHHALREYKLPEITYLDADLYFFQTPGILLKEFKAYNASILITKHRYTPQYDNSAKSGIYCVQFITFVNNKAGMKALEWWREKCLEWCFARCEDGKFGDQKYLDDWTTRFEGVHVLEHIGGGLAPWNVQQYDVAPGPLINGTPAIFYHFHALKWTSDHYFNLADSYLLSEKAVEYLYQPYIKALKEALSQIRKIDGNFSQGIVPPDSGFKSVFNELKRRLKGGYKLISELDAP